MKKAKPTLRELEDYKFWSEHVLPRELENLRRRARTQSLWWVANRLGWLALYALFTALFLRAFR